MIPSRFLNLFSRPWAIDPGYIRGIETFLPGIISAIKSRTMLDVGEERVAREPRPVVAVGGLEAKTKTKVGVMKISGPIVKGISDAECEWYGLCNIDSVHAAADVVHKEGIGHLVIHFNTPGGMVCGITEAADRLASLREDGVTLTAFSDTMCCSAGYWLAAACNETIGSPSSIWGSIGCICLCLDNSGLYEKLGLKTEYFVSKGSEAKLYGRPGQPWADEARASFQESVDEVGKEFKAFVKANRPGLSMADMNGDAWDASTAPKGYVDVVNRSISNLPDLLSMLT